MASMGPKHKLQFIPELDDDQESCGRGDCNRSRTDDDGDEIGMFFALMDRIRATNKILKQKCPSFNPSTSTAAVEAKNQGSKSPWKPSFEWEDFSYGQMEFGGNCRSSNAWDFANNTASAMKEIQKPGKACMIDKHSPVESFDLNAEAPSEPPVPSAL